MNCNMNCKNLENKFYICELCNKQYCINCMYLYCSECKIYCFCFWCGRKKMDTENICQDKSTLCNEHKKLINKII